MKLRDIDLRARWNYRLEEHGKEDAENGKGGLHAASRKFRPLFVSLSCFVVTQRKGANCFTHAVWQCRFQISSLFYFESAAAFHFSPRGFVGANAAFLTT